MTLGFQDMLERVAQLQREKEQLAADHIALVARFHEVEHERDVAHEVARAGAEIHRAVNDELARTQTALWEANHDADVLRARLAMLEARLLDNPVQPVTYSVVYPYAMPDENEVTG